jgi:hypothetical protein
MKARPVVAMILAYLVPGLGHVYLGRRARGVAFFCIVVFLFVLGLSIDGGLYTPASSRGALLKMLASWGSMGSGLLYFIGHELGSYGDVTSSTYEYGSTFTLTAGLMNLLLVLDCYDIARGRKQ